MLFRSTDKKKKKKKHKNKILYPTDKSMEEEMTEMFEDDRPKSME